MQQPIHRAADQAASHESGERPQERADIHERLLAVDALAGVTMDAEGEADGDDQTGQAEHQEEHEGQSWKHKREVRETMEKIFKEENFFPVAQPGLGLV